MATQRAGGPVIAPSLGLYLDRPPLMVPERGLSAGLNFRIANAQIISDNLGWGKFPSSANPKNLDSKPVLLIDSFRQRSGTKKTIFGNTTDLFSYDDNTEALAYITPRYETGTIATTSGSPNIVGTGTLWNTTVGFTKNLKSGDYISVDATGRTSPSSVWYKIQTVNSDTSITLTTNYVGTTAGGKLYTGRSCFTGELDTPFFTEVFYNGAALGGGTGTDRWYATNGIDQIVAWDGAATQVYRPNFGTIETCNYLRRFKNVMFFIAPRISGALLTYAINTSAIGQPENAVTLEASQFIVSDDTAPLIAAIQIGELLAIYSTNSITLAQFVGSPVMYAFRTAVHGVGPRSARAVAQFPDHHVLLATDSQYRFDGVAARPFNTHVWKQVTRQISPQRLSSIITHFDESRGDLIWVVPLTTDANPDSGPPEKAYTTHYLEQIDEDQPQPHSYRELPATALGYYDRLTTLTWDDLVADWTSYNFRWNDQFLQTSFPFTLFGDNLGNIFTLNELSTKAGTPMSVYVRFSRRPVVDNRTRGVVTRLYPHIDPIPGATHSVHCRIRCFDGEATSLQLTTEDDFAVDDAVQVNRFVSPRAPARFVEVEFATDGANEPFALGGYDMDGSRGGKR